VKNVLVLISSAAHPALNDGAIASYDAAKSSAKAVMMLMDKLEAAAKKGAAVEVYWYYDKEDDTMQELGEEFGEDLENAKFHLEKMAG